MKSTGAPGIIWAKNILSIWIDVFIVGTDLAFLKILFTFMSSYVVYYVCQTTDIYNLHTV